MHLLLFYHGKKRREPEDHFKNVSIFIMDNTCILWKTATSGLHPLQQAGLEEGVCVVWGVFWESTDASSVEETVLGGLW